MFQDSKAFSSFSATDLAAARDFYTKVLGLQADEQNGMLTLQLDGGGRVLIYAKPDHQPAVFTVLNFPVPDIDAAVDELTAKGVQMVRYETMQQDTKGIMRGSKMNMGPDIAWFTDPAGNILSVLQDKPVA